MKEVLRFEEIDYVIRYPEDFSKDSKYPLVIYLHGAGGRGRDINIAFNHLFFSQSEPFCKEAVTVVPQCYANTWFDIYEQLQRFIKGMIDAEYVDAMRVYVIGASMGGYTTWQMAMSHPEWFAAAVPICGGGMYWNAERLKNMGIWAFHGSDDTTVYCDESKKMVEKINNKYGGNARLTIYEGVKHDSWTATFTDPEVWKWLFSNTNHYQETENKYNDVVKFG